MNRRAQTQLNDQIGTIACFVRNKRKILGYTQLEFSKRVGVGLRFLKELELGKKTLRMDKVEQVLNFLGFGLAPIRLENKDES